MQWGPLITWCPAGTVALVSSETVMSGGRGKGGEGEPSLASVPSQPQLRRPREQYLQCYGVGGGTLQLVEGFLVETPGALAVAVLQSRGSGSISGNDSRMRTVSGQWIFHQCRLR